VCVQVYYKEAVGAMVVFDVMRISTFEAVTKWKNDIDEKVLLPGTNEKIPVVLLCNKVNIFHSSCFSCICKYICLFCCV